jgi:hypothetical protein
VELHHLLGRDLDGSTDDLAMRDHAEVGTLSGQAISALSGSLQPGIRFLRDPLPAVHSPPLRVIYLRTRHIAGPNSGVCRDVKWRRRTSGLPSSTATTMDDVGTAYTPGVTMSVFRDK